MVDIALPYLKCKRCNHTWIPRTPKMPKVCPKCNSPYWNKDYSRSDKINQKMTQEEMDEIGEITELSHDI